MSLKIQLANTKCDKMMKRNLFDELSEGFEALVEQRQGKLTLRTHEVEIRPEPDLAAAELVAHYPDTLRNMHEIT